jgi:hypothetical protein
MKVGLAGRISMEDFYGGTKSHDDRSARLQVVVSVRPPPHPLHGVHHRITLREKCVAELLGPRHVGCHHFEHGQEREQRLHAGIPRHPVRRDRIGQPLAGQVMVIVCPSRGIGNVGRKRRRCEHLREERVRV